MGIYVNNTLAYTQTGASLSTSLTLAAGTYQTVVTEWDNCGGSTTTPVIITVASSTPANATVVTVSKPAAASSVTSPVAFSATATAPSCAKGIAAMGVYVGNVLQSKVSGSTIGASLAFPAGSQNAVVQEWDNCGGTATQPVAFTVAGAVAPDTVAVSAPAAGATVTSPTTFSGTATAPACVSGVAAMGIYVANKLQYKGNGATLMTTLPLAAGTQSVVMQEWDNCGGTATKAVAFTIAAPAPTTTTATITANPPAVAAGSSSALLVTATNATSVAIAGSDGSTYTLPATGGSTTVTPKTTTTYTVSAVGATQTASATTTVTVTSASAAVYTGVLQWKGNIKSFGQYNETTLTPANVNPTQFGQVRKMKTDGQILAQPLYVRAVNMGTTLGVHDLLIVATEHDGLFAYDGASKSVTPLWQRSFLNATTGVTVQPDNHGGRSTFGGEIGITGTPVIDPATGILYLVAATSLNGVVSDTLHAIDIRTGNDAVAGSAVISANYPGTGEGNVSGMMPFQASQQNQRPGLVLNNGVLYIAFGSFSDARPFHGWLFAYDPTSLTELGVFNSSPTYRADYDDGSEAAFWNGGASPSFEDDGSFYIVAANGSTDAENGGEDYGDTVLHMSFANGVFSVLDWFTPFNRDCIDAADIEMGSGGFALLPEAEVGNGRHLGVALTKEGRLYLLDRTNLGKFNATTDQVVQQFIVGNTTCNSTTTGSAAEGPSWNRLYGNASYWNGNLYMAASNLPIVQFSISGTTINTTPVAKGTLATYYRGGNTVVSSSGNTNGIVWMLHKTSDGNSMLHAYPATNISTELWNSSMNSSRDGLLTGGAGFQVPVVIDGKVFAPSGAFIDMFQLLP